MGSNASLAETAKQRRLVYERLIQYDVEQIRATSHLTARAHFEEQRYMLDRRDFWNQSARVLGASAAIIPVAASSNASLAVRARFPQAGPLIGSVVALVLGSGFYLANQLSEHYTAMEKRSHRAAARWQSLRSQADRVQSRLLTDYTTAERSICDAQHMYAELQETRIDVDGECKSAAKRFFIDVKAMCQTDNEKHSCVVDGLLQQIKKELGHGDSTLFSRSSLKKCDL